MSLSQGRVPSTAELKESKSLLLDTNGMVAAVNPAMHNIMISKDSRRKVPTAMNAWYALCSPLTKLNWTLMNDCGTAQRMQHSTRHCKQLTRMDHL